MKAAPFRLQHIPKTASTKQYAPCTVYPLHTSNTHAHMHKHTRTRTHTCIHVPIHPPTQSVSIDMHVTLCCSERRSGCKERTTPIPNKKFWWSSLCRRKNNKTLITTLSYTKPGWIKCTHTNGYESQVKKSKNMRERRRLTEEKVNKGERSQEACDWSGS